MRGILSATPSPGSARLLVGALLLTLVQMLLVVHSARDLDTASCLIIAITSFIALGALGAAIRGGPALDAQPTWRRRHAR